MTTERQDALPEGAQGTQRGGCRTAAFFGFVGVAIGTLSVCALDADFGNTPTQRAAQWAVIALPWVATGVLLVFHVTTRPHWHPVHFIAGALAAVPLTGAVSLAWELRLEEWWYETTFEAAAWRENIEVAPGWDMRRRMARDLAASTRLAGLTEEEVEHLLGPADAPPRLFVDVLPEWDGWYRIGAAKVIEGPYDDWFVVRFGPQRRVQEWDIVGTGD